MVSPATLLPAWQCDNILAGLNIQCVCIDCVVDILYHCITVIILIFTHRVQHRVFSFSHISIEENRDHQINNFLRTGIFSLERKFEFKSRNLLEDGNSL